MLSWVEHEKSFIISGPGCLYICALKTQFDMLRLINVFFLNKTSIWTTLIKMEVIINSCYLLFCVQFILNWHLVSDILLESETKDRQRSSFFVLFFHSHYMFRIYLKLKHCRLYHQMLVHDKQSTLTISTSLISNNRLSRSEILVPVLTWKSKNS